MLSTLDRNDSPHVTYLPHRHCFAVWRSSDVEPLSPHTTPIALAVPGTDGTVSVRTMYAWLVETTAQNFDRRSARPAASSTVHRHAGGSPSSTMSKNQPRIARFPHH